MRKHDIEIQKRTLERGYRSQKKKQQEMGIKQNFKGIGENSFLLPRPHFLTSRHRLKPLKQSHLTRPQNNFCFLNNKNNNNVLGFRKNDSHGTLSSLSDDFKVSMNQWNSVLNVMLTRTLHPAFCFYFLLLPGLFCQEIVHISTSEQECSL